MTALACAVLGACATVPDRNPFSPPPVLASSPIAAEVTAVTEAPSAGYPEFCEIPRVPTNLRTLAEWQTVIAEVKAVGAQSDAAARAGLAPADSEAFADAARAEATAPPPMSQSSTEEFLREMRDRATPPPRPR